MAVVSTLLRSTTDLLANAGSGAVRAVGAGYGWLTDWASIRTPTSEEEGLMDGGNTGEESTAFYAQDKGGRKGQLVTWLVLFAFEHRPRAVRNTVQE